MEKLTEEELTIAEMERTISQLKSLHEKNELEPQNQRMVISLSIDCMQSMLKTIKEQHKRIQNLITIKSN